MSDQDRYLLDIYRGGDAFTLRTRSGDQCGCWEWRTTGYSKQWHRTGEPGAAVADCQGTGLQNIVTVDVSLKGHLIDVSNAPSNLMESIFPKEWIAVIGKIKQEKLYLIGSLNVAQSESTQLPVFYDLSDAKQHEEEVRFNSKVYKIRMLAPIYDVAQQAILVRHE